MSITRIPLWRPASEAEATSNMAVFVEWLRGTGRDPEASPDAVRLWWRREPDALLAAVAAFACLAASEDYELLEALARKLLIDEMRPGDSFLWSGGPHDPQPRAALVLGAKVILVRPGDAAGDARENPSRSLP